MRGRGCLVAVAVALALIGGIAALFGPGALRHARGIFAPIGRMKDAQRDFEAWTRQRGWHEPSPVVLLPDRLDGFLALRRELHDLDDRAAAARRGAPRKPTDSFENAPAILEGVESLLSARLDAFRKRDMTPAEYDFIDRLVYVTWLPALSSPGNDPAARERAAREIEDAAAHETSDAVRSRLRQIAAGLRARVPPAPAGVPDDVHRLLLSRAADIEAQPPGRIPSRISQRGADRR